MSMILGHRGYSAQHLENSIEAFKAALSAGMDGFELDVQPTLDGVCMVLHDEDLARTSKGKGKLRKMKSTELPLLKNGEPVPRLTEVFELSAKLINIELKGEPGWKQALAAVEASEALGRVLFSSFEHSEVLQLWAECPEARCGFLWDFVEADYLEADELEALPIQLTFHVPITSVLKKPELWKPYAKRLAVWGMKNKKEADGLNFEPGILIIDGI